MRIHGTFDWLLLGSDDVLVHQPTIIGSACTFLALVNAAPRSTHSRAFQAALVQNTPTFNMS